MFRFEMLESSVAIQKQERPDPHAPLHAPPQGSSHRVAIKKFLAPFQEQTKRLTNEWPHHNRLLALAHAFCEIVTQKTKDKLKSMDLAAACQAGCDACCYYADMDATGLEFEEIVHYIKHTMPAPRRQHLYQQVTETPEYTRHQHQPCPFLDRTDGQCGIYPVRPMGCRGLLATKTCHLDREEDTGLALTVRLVQQSWQEMPVRAGALMIAQEQQRKGKGHVNLKQSSSEILVKFKQLEPHKLKALFH